jgi:hypothetical protein
MPAGTSGSSCPGRQGPCPSAVNGPAPDGSKSRRRCNAPASACDIACRADFRAVPCSRTSSRAMSRRKPARRSSSAAARSLRNGPALGSSTSGPGSSIATFVTEVGRGRRHGGASLWPKAGCAAEPIPTLRRSPRGRPRPYRRYARGGPTWRLTPSSLEVGMGTRRSARWVGARPSRGDAPARHAGSPRERPSSRCDARLASPLRP